MTEHKYADIMCPRTRRKMAAGRQGGAVEKYQSNHCLVCNYYWHK